MAVMVMNRYRQLYDGGKARDSFDECAGALERDSEAMSWEDLYWCAKILYVYGKPNEIDEDVIIDAFRSSFRKGLDITSDRELFLDASVMISRLYVKYGRYELAINYLMHLVELIPEDDIPDWIHSFYAYVQVLSPEHFEFILRQPKHFLARLSKIRGEAGIARRNEIVLHVAERLFGRMGENEENGVEPLSVPDEIVRKFREAAKSFGIGDKFDAILFPKNDGEGDVSSLLYEKDAKIEELLSEIDKLRKERSSGSGLSEEIARLSSENARLSSLVEELRTEISSLQRALGEAMGGASPAEEVGAGGTGDAGFDGSNGHSLLTRYQRNQKILVIGEGSKNPLLLRARKRGFVEDDFEFVLDYDKIPRIAAQMNFGGYAGIICGPMPHSGSGMEDESSLISKIEKSFPCVVRSVTKGGKLKLSDTAFSAALERVMQNMFIMDAAS